MWIFSGHIPEKLVFLKELCAGSWKQGVCYLLLTKPPSSMIGCSQNSLPPCILYYQSRRHGQTKNAKSCLRHLSARSLQPPMTRDFRDSECWARAASFTRNDFGHRCSRRIPLERVVAVLSSLKKRLEKISSQSNVLLSSNLFFVVKTQNDFPLSIKSKK